METLQTTLELMDLDSEHGDELDSDFEAELLEDAKNSENSKTSLDDRLVSMEFQALQELIDDLVKNDVSFGTSGMLASAVTYKDLTPEELIQLQTNAIAISRVVNELKEKLDNPHYMGLATLTLLRDDLYQAGFQIDSF